MDYDFDKQIKMMLMEIGIHQGEGQEAVEAIIKKHMKNSYINGRKSVKDMLDAVAESRQTDGKDLH